MRKRWSNFGNIFDHFYVINFKFVWKTTREILNFQLQKVPMKVIEAFFKPEFRSADDPISFSKNNGIELPSLKISEEKFRSFEERLSKIE